jgi:uncharacterized protein (TIGR03067 family)
MRRHADLAARIPVILLVTSMTLLAAGAVRAQDEAAPATGVEGNWRADAAETGTGPVEPGDLQTVTISLVGGVYEVHVEGHGTTDAGTYTVEEGKKPHQMRVVVSSGPNQGRTFPAIYEMPDANTLRICYDLSGQKYPKKFEAVYGTPLYLVTYKRAAPAAAAPTP